MLAIATLGTAPPDDVGSIVRALRPAQRSNLILVHRDGSVQIVAFEPAMAPFEIADVPIEQRIVAEPAARRIAAAPPWRPAVRRVPFPVERVNPIAVAALPKLPLLHVRAPFVPTLAVAKPVDRPAAPPGERDLAWLYRHRFDAPSTERGAPGIPVRSQVSSPFDVDSGAFHGVRARNGYSAVRVAVSIPCGARHFVTGPGYNEVTGEPGTVDLETGYIYIGGWGAGPGGVSVDAGLQKSSAQAEHDEYAFYWKYAKNAPVTSEERFPCGGPDVVLELYPLSPSLLLFSETGVTRSGSRQTLTVVQQTNAADGWIPSGGSGDDGIILKRIVSIAQPWSWHARSGVGKRDRFATGSYFGVDGPHDLTPRIVWHDCEIGRVSATTPTPAYEPWTGAQTWATSTPGIYTDWPPLDVVRRTDGACDATGIYLRA